MVIFHPFCPRTWWYGQSPVSARPSLLAVHMLKPHSSTKQSMLEIAFFQELVRLFMTTLNNIKSLYDIYWEILNLFIYFCIVSTTTRPVINLIVAKVPSNESHGCKMIYSNGASHFKIIFITFLKCTSYPFSVWLEDSSTAYFFFAMVNSFRVHTFNTDRSNTLILTKTTLLGPNKNAYNKLYFVVF